MQLVRKHPRLTVKHKVTVTVEGSEGEKADEPSTHVCYTQDISVGGMRIDAPAKLPVGTDVRLHLRCGFPRRDYHMTGRVVWTAPATDHRHSVGIEFADLSKEDLLAWSRMLERAAS